MSWVWVFFLISLNYCFSPFRDTAESDRKRKRATEDKSKSGEEEKRKKEEGKGKDAEGKEPETKKKKQSKDDGSSGSDDEEAGVQSSQISSHSETSTLFLIRRLSSPYAAMLTCTWLWFVFLFRKTKAERNNKTQKWTKMCADGKQMNWKSTYAYNTQQRVSQTEMMIPYYLEISNFSKYLCNSNHGRLWHNSFISYMCWKFLMTLMCRKEKRS